MRKQIPEMKTVPSTVFISEFFVFHRVNRHFISIFRWLDRELYNYSTATYAHFSRNIRNFVGRNQNGTRYRFFYLDSKIPETETVPGTVSVSLWIDYLPIAR